MFSGVVFITHFSEGIVSTIVSKDVIIAHWLEGIVVAPFPEGDRVTLGVKGIIEASSAK